MENPGNMTSGQKVPETSGRAQALQVVTSIPPTSTVAVYLVVFITITVTLRRSVVTSRTKSKDSSRMGTYKNTCVGRKLEEPAPTKRKKWTGQRSQSGQPRGLARGGLKMGTKKNRS
ncbi:UNVERIFIED_CONTAM: hypothetical protein Slati_4426700 [Sesamum latifolium]|uniref:Uncharacterized protein n=1 Tax=Sesamum latifolium TaxID=2727402 RepID=A0AAW2SR58_9LAMI